MPKVIVYFVVGLVAGFTAIFLACQLALALPPFKDMVEAAQKRSQSHGEYEAWYENRVLSRELLFSAFAGLLCGGLGGLRAVQEGKRSRGTFRRSLRGWAKGGEEPLTPTEFARVLHCCLFSQVAEREPAYVQGLIVGRLLETDPELARKVDQFSPEHMTALWRDLRRASQIR